MLKEGRRGVQYGGIDTTRAAEVNLPGDGSSREKTTGLVNGSSTSETNPYTGRRMSLVEGLASVLNRGRSAAYDERDNVIVEGGRVWRENLPPATSSRYETSRPVWEPKTQINGSYDDPNYDIDSVKVEGGRVLRGGDNIYDPDNIHNRINGRGVRYDARDDAFTEEDW